MLIHEIFRTFPLILLILTPVYTVIFKSKIALWLFIGLIINGVIWTVLNPIIKKYFPEIAKRPSTKSCYYLENNETVEAGGMPSGHCQSAAFFSIYMILVVWEKTQNIIYTLLSVLVGLFLTGFMMYSRFSYYKCHSVTQTIVGSLIGSSTAFILWYIMIIFKDYL